MEFKDGDKISCRIGGIAIKDARITVQDNRFYICQNVRDGNACDDKKGYKYSWQMCMDLGCYNMKKVELKSFVREF